MKLSKHFQAGIERSIVLKRKQELLAREHPGLKLESKYGKIRVLVESADDLSRLLCLGFSWKLESYFSYAAVEDPHLGCDISWRFLREFIDRGWERLILGSSDELDNAV